MSRTLMMRLIPVFGVLLALTVPAAATARCGGLSGLAVDPAGQAPLRQLLADTSCGNNCNDVKLGPKTAKCSYPPTATSDSRFLAKDFMRTCIGDPGKGCDAPANTVDKSNATMSCCSCYLYAKHCAKASGDFVQDHDFSDKHPHVLLMPTAACTGVENWDQSPCKNEDIWDEGKKILDGAKKDTSWGMAINPVSRRGMHQMHVHLAQVHAGLVGAVVKVANITSRRSFVTCSGTGHQTDKCQLKAAASGIDRTNTIEVTVHNKHPNPSGANPFGVAYGPNPKRANTLVLWASTLVVRVPKTDDSWAVVTNPTGPAECFFTSTTDKCS